MKELTAQAAGYHQMGPNLTAEVFLPQQTHGDLRILLLCPHILPGLPVMSFPEPYASNSSTGLTWGNPLKGTSSMLGGGGGGRGRSVERGRAALWSVKALNRRMIFRNDGNPLGKSVSETIDLWIERGLKPISGLDTNIYIACLRQVVAFAPKVIIIACLRQWFCIRKTR
jgi:hypothetical protein